MKVYVFLYNEYAEFEISTACLFLRNSEIITVSLGEKYVETADGRKMVADIYLSEVEVDDVDCFLIPGGESFKNEELQNLLISLDKKNKIIGAICGGADFLFNAGILENREFTAWTRDKAPEYVTEECNYKNEGVVVDDNIITAQGNAFIDFAVEVAKRMGIYKNESEPEEDRKWFKNIF